MPHHTQPSVVNGPDRGPQHVVVEVHDAVAERSSPPKPALSKEALPVRRRLGAAPRTRGGGRASMAARDDPHLHVLADGTRTCARRRSRQARCASPSCMPRSSATAGSGGRACSSRTRWACNFSGTVLGGRARGVLTEQSSAPSRRMASIARGTSSVIIVSASTRTTHVVVTTGSAAAREAWEARAARRGPCGRLASRHARPRRRKSRISCVEISRTNSTCTLPAA